MTDGVRESTVLLLSGCILYGGGTNYINIIIIIIILF